MKHAERLREAMRRMISEGAVGKTIESLEWDEGGGYWVMRFTDGTETCWSRNMAEGARGHIFLPGQAADTHTHKAEERVEWHGEMLEVCACGKERVRDLATGKVTEWT